MFHHLTFLFSLRLILSSQQKQDVHDASGRKATSPAMCRYRNLFMRFGSVQVSWVRSWPSVQHTRRGQCANQATKTPQLRWSLGKSNNSLAELMALMSFYKGLCSLLTASGGCISNMITRQQGHGSSFSVLLLLTWIECKLLGIFMSNLSAVQYFFFLSFLIPGPLYFKLLIHFMYFILTFMHILTSGLFVLVYKYQ